VLARFRDGLLLLPSGQSPWNQPRRWEETEIRRQLRTFEPPWNEAASLSLVSSPCAVFNRGAHPGALPADSCGHGHSGAEAVGGDDEDDGDSDEGPCAE